MADPEVVAIVPNWRLADSTLQVLEDLGKVDYTELFAVVIDNGSGDGSAQRLREMATASVEVVAFEENLGYCIAMNRGIDRAVERGAPYVLFLNNDVRLPPGFLRPLVETLENDPRVACVGPTIVDPSGRTWSQGGGVRFRPNLVTLFGQGGAPAATDTGPGAVEFLPGACALYRVADLETVGRLDEDYFMYWEDVDLGRRLRAHGRLVLWLPWVVVVHQPSRSSGGGRTPLRKYMSAANTVRFLRRHGGLRLWLAFLLFDCAMWPLTLLSGTGPRAAFAKARGLWDGLRGRKVSAADVARYHPESTS